MNSLETLVNCHLTLGLQIRSACLAKWSKADAQIELINRRQVPILLKNSKYFQTAKLFAS